MKRILAAVISACMLLSPAHNVFAQNTYTQVNEAFAQLDLASLFPGWDIQYATENRHGIILTCPTMNVQFKEVLAQLYNFRNKVVTADAAHAMSFVIRYLYSSGVKEEYLTTSQTGFGMILSQHSSLADAIFGITEFADDSGNPTGRRMDIYLNANGGFTVDELYVQYFDKMKQLVREAREYSHYQTDQLDYFVRWLHENTTYELGVPARPAQLVVNGSGVCDHYSNAVLDFCTLAGIPCLFVENVIKVHSWNYLCLDNMWYEYDATNFGHLGVNEATLFKPTYGTKAGDEFSAKNLTYVKETLLKNGVRVVLDGRSLGFDQPPVIRDGRTLVPLRVIFEALGASVEWNGETQSVTAEKDGVTVTMSIGNDVYYVNGEEKYLDVPPQIINGRTLVPARAVAESFNCSVDWMEQMNTVIINSAH